MRIFPKSVKNGQNQASKSAKDLEVFFCPFDEAEFYEEIKCTSFEAGISVIDVLK